MIENIKRTQVIKYYGNEHEETVGVSEPSPREVTDKINEIINWINSKSDQLL